MKKALMITTTIPNQLQASTIEDLCHTLRLLGLMLVLCEPCLYRALTKRKPRYVVLNHVAWCVMHKCSYIVRLSVDDLGQSHGLKCGGLSGMAQLSRSKISNAASLNIVAGDCLRFILREPNATSKFCHHCEIYSPSKPSS